MRKPWAIKGQSTNYVLIVGLFARQNQVQRMLQREVPRFAGFCAGG